MVYTCKKKNVIFLEIMVVDNRDSKNVCYIEPETARTSMRKIASLQSCRRRLYAVP